MVSIVQQLKYNARWKEKNQDKVNAQKRRWRQRHPDKVRAQKERYLRKKYSTQNELWVEGVGFVSRDDI